MDRIYDNTVLLYRIVPKERYVDFIITQSKDNIIKNITEKDITRISYDDLLRYTIEFHQSFSQIKMILSQQKKLMRKNKTKADINLTMLDAFENDSNFLFKYYINKIRSLFIAEHSYVAKKEWIEKWCKTEERIDLFINNIEAITNPTYFSHYYTATENELLSEPDFIVQDEVALKRGVKAHIRVDGHLVQFNVSFFSLIEFFDDFSYLLSDSEAFVNKCKCCNNYFFGEKDTSYCAAVPCQNEYKRILKNKKEYERTHAPDKKPIKQIDDYVSTTKSRLRKATNSDTKLLAEFYEKAEEIKTEIRNEIERRKIDGEPLNDPSINSYVSDLENLIYDKYKALIYRFNNSQ